MTVMVIMFILMGMATLALRGVVRGAGISGAVATTRAILTQARQHAIFNQRPTAVLFRQQGETNAMEVVTRYGKAAAGVGGSTTLQVAVELPWTATELNGTRVYNMTAGTRGFLQGNTLNPDSRSVFNSNISWRAGDEVAFLVGDERFLQDGLEFDALPDPSIVIFNSDGSARADATIRVQEKLVAGASANAAELTVRQMTGWVEVQ